MKILSSLFIFAACSLSAFAQVPKIEPGVSHDLAAWRAAHYSDVRYKLNLTLEKMSPVLKGTIEIRMFVIPKANTTDVVDAMKAVPPIILDWEKIAGHEKESSISNVSINGEKLENPPSDSPYTNPRYEVLSGHLIFRDDVGPGENVITLEFSSPILTSGSAITRYVDKEDGSEYIYSILSPSNASTAFPVFDQPDLKARFTLTVFAPTDWKVISNSDVNPFEAFEGQGAGGAKVISQPNAFKETKPISPNIFALLAGPFTDISSAASHHSSPEIRFLLHTLLPK